VATLAPGPAAGSWGAWWLASRPRTLGAALSPVLVGSAAAWAEGAARPLPALAAALGAVCLQVATNLLNDAADFERGADDARRAGPLRAAQAGLLDPETLRRGALLTLAAAVGVGLYLAFQGGWPIIVLGSLAMAAGWAYTGGPAPLGYRGLGDPLVFLFFGLFAVAGTHFVQTGVWSGQALLAGVPLGLLATAILVANNLRDREGDARVGKRTLAVRLGPRWTRAYYAGLLAGSYLAAGLLPLLGSSPAAALLPLGSAPLAGRAWRCMRRGEGVELAPALWETARLEWAFAALLALGLAAGRIP